MSARGAPEAEASGDVISIVIPARDEERVLDDTLRAVLDQDYPGKLHVAVAANGCADGTADVARRWRDAFARRGHELVVVELAEGGKCAALNAAEAQLPASPRLFLDADVLPAPNAVRVIAGALSDGRTHLCAPAVRVLRARSSWSRSYYRAWLATAPVREEVIGAGLLAVSRAGRERWKDFPPIVADDYFIRTHFAPDERRVLREATFDVRPAEGLRELVETRSRWMRGESEFGRPRPASRGRGWRDLLARPGVWRDVPAYFLAAGCAALLARWRRGRGPETWERSTRSRKALG